MSRRLRVTLAAGVVMAIMFGLLDHSLQTPNTALVDALNFSGALVLLGALYLLRRPHEKGTLVAIALVTVAAMYVVTVLTNFLTGDNTSAPLITLAVSLCAATLLPWGVAPQLAIVAIAVVANAVLMWLLAGSLWGLVTHSNAAIAVGLALSVYIAMEFERRRGALERRSNERQRAEAEVRRLNQELEGRVRERTAQLERLNLELATQVAERTRAEADLRASEAAVTALIENAADAIWSVDTQHRLLVCNAEARSRFGTLWGDACGSEPRHTPVPICWPPPWAGLYDRALAGERFVVEQEMDGAHGARSYRTAFNPVVVDKRVEGVAVFSTDMTERIRSEEAARRHRNELTHVLRVTTVSEMATGLAHEINQPLGAIANYAQGCSARLRADSIERAELLEVVESITGEALRAAAIIRRLRTLIRKDVPRHVPFDLREIALDAVRLSEAEARAAGVMVRLDASAAVPPVAGDAIQIEQVILNLIRNAVEAMADTPAEHRVVDLRVVPGANGDVEIVVTDAGSGVAPGVAAHLFEPFTSTKPGGLGMGLSISRTIVEAHHGRVWATPNPTGGSSFHVALPTLPA